MKKKLFSWKKWLGGNIAISHHIFFLVSKMYGFLWRWAHKKSQETSHWFMLLFKSLYSNLLVSVEHFFFCSCCSYLLILILQIVFGHEQLRHLCYLVQLVYDWPLIPCISSGSLIKLGIIKLCGDRKWFSSICFILFPFNLCLNICP